jgi:two-component system chemotaxis response regulator CheB
MPELFTKLLAERLDAMAKVQVCEAEAGQFVKQGVVYIAPGGHHMETVRSADRVQLRLHDGPPENSCRPAADVLFRSVAQCYGGGVLAVVLTGMGQDGLRGCEVLREAGAQVITQDEASSIVWGMPRAVTEAGLAEMVLPLEAIAAEIVKRVQGHA